MTKDEIIRVVLTGLRSQNWEQSIKEDGRCMYRGPRGRKCAAGWLIPDEMYHKSLEGNSIPALYAESQAIRALIGNEGNRRLVTDLQLLHDNEMYQYIGSPMEARFKNYITNNFPHLLPEFWPDAVPEA